jgi:phosphate starvation-inducible protein PhoH and related proteins
MSTENRQVQLRQVDLTTFYGPNDANLRLLEKSFNSRIVARGEDLVLKGDNRELDELESVITELVFLAQRNKRLTPQDVETVIRLTRTGNGSRQSEESLQDVVLFTHSGHIVPRTEGQQRYYESTKKNDIVFAIGPAGTGKTFLAVGVALSYLKERSIKKIILARPAVEAGESLGFLPGDLREKVDPYLRPLYDALDSMLPRDAVRSYLDRQVVEIVPLAYMRGRTLDNAFLILDEAQNATALQMKMFLTRLGANSRAIITGDVTQIDLPNSQQSGLVQIQDVLHNIDGIDFIYLDRNDVVRHRLVRDIILAYADHAKQQGNGTPDAAEGNSSS